MMTLVINVPGILFDFISVDARVKYKKVQISSESYDLKNFEMEKFELLEDAYSIEELSYRSRIFLFSYLDKYYIEKALIHFNLDIFVTDVISVNLKSIISIQQLVNEISIHLHSRNWMFLTDNELQANTLKTAGIKTILIGKENKFSSFLQFVDFTSSHRIDKSLYVSKGCK